MLKFAIVLLTLSLMFLSCSDDSNPSEPTEHFAISINDLPDTISGIVGTTQEASFYVVLKREDESVVKGATVKFTDPTGIGLVTPEEAVTNDAGEVNATYSVVMPMKATTTRIHAEVNNQVASATISLRPVRSPKYINLEARPPTITLGYNSPNEAQITASIYDAEGFAIPGIYLAFSLDPECNPEIIGSVIPSAATDSSGRAFTTFRSFDKVGIAEITARVDEPGFDESIQSHVRVEIRQRSIATLDISLSMVSLWISQVAPRDTVYSVGITTIVQDSDGQIIMDAPPIQFTTTHGRIFDGALHFNPAIDMENNESFTISIHASIPGYPVFTTKELNIQVKNDLPILTLSSDRYAIQADGSGGNVAILNVTLATPQGMPVPGVPIRISATENSCLIQSPVVTDSMGRASAVLDDIGQPHLVTVTAESKYGTSESIEISILENVTIVESIDLFVENTTLRSQINDSTRVTARCILPNGLPAPAGTSIHFEAGWGELAEQIVAIQGRNGIAETFYYASGSVGVDSIYAYAIGDGDTVRSNIVAVRVLSGHPSQIILRADPEEIFTNDPHAQSIITATVIDTFGMPVRFGTLVQYETTLGTIGRSALTNENGEAITILNPGVQAGRAVITATVETENGMVSGQTTVNFTAGTPNSIELDCDPLFAEVTQHHHPSTLRATIRDANGNLIQVRTPVVFEMINEPEPPAGCTIGNERDQSFVSYTSSGVAVASLNPGGQIGGKLIRAYTWRDSAARPDDVISTMFAGFAVISGPPFQLDLSVNNIGIDAGGGAWAIEVSARVWDMHRNPVADRIPVVFTVEPEIASIEAGWTGNENRNGISVRGLAFATLVYNSVNSLDEIEISAEVQTVRGQIDRSIEIILPVQGGVVFLEEIDGDFIFDNENEVINARFAALLIDGHLIRIDNAPLTYMSDLGRFDPDQPGLWTATMDDIFFDPEVNEQAVTFRVRVDGTNIVSQPLQIVVRRR